MEAIRKKGAEIAHSSAEFFHHGTEVGWTVGKKVGEEVTKKARKIACFFFGGVKLGCFSGGQLVSFFNLKPWDAVEVLEEFCVCKGSGGRFYSVALVTLLIFTRVFHHSLNQFDNIWYHLSI